MCDLYLQTLGVQAFPGLRTGRDLAETGHHVSRGHHVQSESLTVRTSGCIAIDSVVDPRWHGLRTSTSGRIAFNAVGMDMDMDWIFIYFPPTSLISSTNIYIYIYRLPVRTASRLCQLWRLPSKWRIWIIKFLWIFAASNGIHLYLKKVCLYINTYQLLFYREFLGQSWMKSTKKTRAEHIIHMTKRFNDGSRLVSSEIITRCDIPWIRSILFQSYLILLTNRTHNYIQMQYLRTRCGHREVDCRRGHMSMSAQL